MTVLFFLLNYVPFSFLAPQNKADDKGWGGVWLCQPCGEKTWGHLAVIIFVESSAHSPTPSVPHCPDANQVCCSWEAEPGPHTTPLHATPQALTWPGCPTIACAAAGPHLDAS